MADDRIIDMNSPEILELSEALERQRVADEKLTGYEILDRFLKRIADRLNDTP